MKTMVGAVIDPLADKTLMTVLTIVFAMKNLLQCNNNIVIIININNVLFLIYLFFYYFLKKKTLDKYHFTISTNGSNHIRSSVWLDGFTSSYHITVRSRFQFIK